MTNIASCNIQKDRVGRKQAIPQKRSSITKTEKSSSPPKRQGRLQQTNNNRINVMDFSLYQGSSLNFANNQNANFNYSFNQSLQVTSNLFKTGNNQIPCRSLKHIINNRFVTLFRLCEACVFVCYGCSLKFNSVTSNPPFDLVVVVKMRQEFRQNSLKQVIVPSKRYFYVVHNNPFYKPFPCVARRFLNFNNYNISVEIFDILSIHYNILKVKHCNHFNCRIQQL